MSKIYIACVVLLCTGLCGWIILHEDNNSGERNSHPTTTSVREGEARSPYRVTEHTSRNNDSSQGSKHALQKLKKQWLALERRSSSDEDRESLARSSVLELRFTEDLFRLCLFLEKRGIEYGKSKILYNTSLLLTDTPNSRDMEQLAAIASYSLIREYDISADHLHIWLSRCAQNGADKDVENLISLIGRSDTNLARWAIMGRNMRWAAQPAKSTNAIQSSLKILDSSKKQDGAMLSAFRKQIRGLPRGSDFASIEKMLREGKGFVDDRAYKDFVATWTLRDPSEVMNYVLDQDVNPKAVEWIAESVMGQYYQNENLKYKDLTTWIKNMPEGNHRRRVINGLVARSAFDDPDIARKLAALSSDTNHRSEVLKKIDFIQKQKQSGDRY